MLERGIPWALLPQCNSFLWNGYPEETWDALFASLISVQRLQSWDNGLITVGFCLLHVRQWHLFTLLGSK